MVSECAEFWGWFLSLKPLHVAYCGVSVGTWKRGVRFWWVAEFIGGWMTAQGVYSVRQPGLKSHRRKQKPSSSSRSGHRFRYLICVHILALP